MKQTERPSLRYGPTEMFKAPQKGSFQVEALFRPTCFFYALGLFGLH